MSQRFDHYGYPVFGRSMYDNSRVEPESWEEQFSEAAAEQFEKDKCDRTTQAMDDKREPTNADH